eukprot:GFUD01032988.1.p1 GENE.GFUD01032988.1~~GFUD01032988.1.p1  ORF type:complete len:130 (+),score=53.87 GFUD01032988.1:96-485(+)
MDKDENYMYGEDKRGSREERDPRKRKRQSSEIGFEGGDGFEERKERGRSRSRDRGNRRGKSRSASPEDSYRKGGGAAREDEWKKKSEAFLQKLNIAPPSDPRLAGGQGYPVAGGGGGGGGAQDRRQQQG